MMMLMVWCGWLVDAMPASLLLLIIRSPPLTCLLCSTLLSLPLFCLPLVAARIAFTSVRRWPRCAACLLAACVCCHPPDRFLCLALLLPARAGVLHVSHTPCTSPSPLPLPHKAHPCVVVWRSTGFWGCVLWCVPCFML